MKNPDKGIKGILLFGPDSGLARERAKSLVDRFAPAGDPFAVSEISGDVLRRDPAMLADQSQSMSLMGGDPVLRVRDVPDTATPAIESWLAGGGGANPVIFEAGDLSPRSKLRVLFEKDSALAAIGCYPDEGRDLATVVNEHFRQNGVSMDRDALPVLMNRLGTDRLAIRQELDKLVLYVGGPNSETPVTAEAVEALIGDVKSASLDDVALAVGSGDTQSLGRALDRAFAEGNPPIMVIRAVQRHFDRLHDVVSRGRAGESIDQAMKKLRPPVFYKHTRGFAMQADRWTPKELARAIGLLLDAERDCKSGLDIDAALCERALIQIAQAARRKRR